MLVIWDFERRETRVVGVRKESAKLPVALLGEFFSTIWRIAAMEGIKTYSGMWNKEKGESCQVESHSVKGREEPRGE